MSEGPQTPPPIDRPLGKSYLREFAGWSTAYPPGVSEPNSLRVMHNCSIAPDKSVRIRPGMRRVFSTPAGGDIVGDFEHFYTTDGKKALLFAIRDTTNSNRIVFRTAVWNASTKLFDVDSTLSARFPGASDSVATFTSDTTFVRYVQIDNKVLALSNNSQSFILFYVGSNPKVIVPKTVTRPRWNSADRARVIMPPTSWVSGAQTSWTNGTAGRAASGSTLISSTGADNVYNFGYFYTFSNEIGETPGSMMTVVQGQRRWTVWDADFNDDTKSNDQLLIEIPTGTWNTAVSDGATAWNLYFFTWSNAEPVPVEGLLLKTIPMTGKTQAEAGWTTHTPLLQYLDGSLPLPQSKSRDNFTTPSAASQGRVMGDRLVLVYDKNNAARIQWTSNYQGDYLNFSSSRGGGFKTLTSGNLFLPVAAELWQNPSSVDTMTVLCAGMDGDGTAYYMNPGTTVNTLSQVTTVMGFEETTATSGTVSPFGCEVLNNALYHPTENRLIKSTASNYNISHTSMTDVIENMWSRVLLDDKKRMVSAQMDQALYYLVRSPVGWLPAENHNGNQIWVCDIEGEGIWSCWDVVGTSLAKLEVEGLLYMSISTGPNIFIFDPEYDHDDIWENGAWAEQGIRWEIVTNTQGANRAHDAWAQLQQANVMFGNFTGECEYGIRGVDVYGKPIEVVKYYISPQIGRTPLERYDQMDHLLIRRIMQEWEFFWRSAPRPKNRSQGAVTFVQYRYTPSTVNVGYEYGSIETFEYGQRGIATYSTNGVPIPFADTRKP